MKHVRRMAALALVVMWLAAFAGTSHSVSGEKLHHIVLPSRRFAFQYLVHVPALPAGNGGTRIWIPLPPSGEHQRIENLRIASPVPCRITREEQYGNRLAYCAYAGALARKQFDISLTFVAQRYEYKVALPLGYPSPPSGRFPAGLARFLQPDHLVPINGVIGELSREETAGLADPLQKARKIYDYVISTMHYDHDGAGWGRGDAVWACSSHHGNCTDFHSLFIGLARAAGIPARFDIGFPLPLNQHQGKISGYHCWAEFYVRGVGWIPIDAAEAWEMPEKHNYFFGAIDQNRVRFSRGRDLILSPAQAGGAVNYIIYPYAEVDGKPFANLGHEFSFRDLARSSLRP